MQYYSAIEKRVIHTSTWEEHVALVNQTTEILEKLPYREALDHEDVTILPSAHPWWKFQAYLYSKQIWLKTIKTHRETSRILTPDLNWETASRVRSYLQSLCDQEITAKKSYQTKQLELNR